MQRSGNENVPGCEVSSRDEGQDFCYNPSGGNTDDGGEDDVKLPPAGTLGRVGNNGDPSSAFPLQECHGDCDSDGKHR